jgi:hypothetical protein
MENGQRHDDRQGAHALLDRQLDPRVGATGKAGLDEDGIQALRSMAKDRPAQLEAGQREALLHGADAHGFGFHFH